jgi:hypothetical protein
VVTGRNLRTRFQPNEPAGAGFIHRNPHALPRARLAGRPVYVGGKDEAIAVLERCGPELRDRLVVEDPARPLDPDALVSGTARIVTDLPERVVIHTESAAPSYLVLADTFDPGWSASLDGEAVPIRPAYVGFRAVFLPAGRHTVIFTYRPAGFALGLGVSACGALVSLVLLILPGRLTALGPDHLRVSHAMRWRRFGFLTLAAILVLSTAQLGTGGQLTFQDRWKDSFHQFTWGAGIEAMRANRK